jgi:thymidylate synthase
MNKADIIFKRNIKEILKNGVMSGDARPVYSNGQKAHSKYITQICDTYDLQKGEFPITTLRQIPVKSAIKEIFWIYQDQSNKLDILEDKYKVKYWRAWEVDNTNTIGERYGAVVRKNKIIDKLLKQLEDNPWNRRNIISLWDYESFEKTNGLLPCAYNTMFDVRKIGDKIYLDCTLTQRSNDMLVAHHINAMQYVALQMMIACHFGWEVGKFCYFVNNLHIYDNQFEQAKELLSREPISCNVELKLNAKPKTNFYDIKPEDFELINYEYNPNQLKFDLAI